jgi:O-antigen/teichoic acid export membrane protein
MTSNQQTSQATERQRVRGASTVFSDYASVLGARLVSGVLSVISITLTTRILDPEGYGAVAYVNVIALLIFTVTSAWTSTAVNRYGREELDEHGSMVAVTWSRIQLTAPLLAIGALMVVLIKVAGGFPAELTWPLAFLAIGYGVVLVAADHVVYSLQAAGRMKMSAAQLITRQLIAIAALAAVLVTGIGDSPLAVAAITATGAAIATVTYGKVITRISLWPPRVDAALRRRILVFSVPLVAFTLSQYVIRSVDLVVIGAFATATAVGTYAIAYQAYGVLQLLTTVSGSVLTPLFVSLRSAGREDILDRFVERAVPQLTLVAATVAGLAVPFVGIAVPVVFGEAYAGASDPLAILLFALVLGFTVNLYAPVLMLHERTAPVGAINFVAAVVNVVGDIVLVGPAGLHLEGPAIATAATLAMILAGYVLVVRGCVKAHPSYPALALLPFGAGLVPALTLTNSLAVPIGIVATLACAAVVTLLTRPFQSEDLELISRLDMPAPFKRIALRTLAFTAR